MLALTIIILLAAILTWHRATLSNPESSKDIWNSTHAIDEEMRAKKDYEQRVESEKRDELRYTEKMYHKTHDHEVIF